MKIEFDVIPLPTRHAFHIAREAKARTRVSVWVRVRDEDGAEGWGEAAATPFYGETAETVTAVLPRYAEVLEEAAAGDVFAIERMERALEVSLGRNPAARAAISCALHDLIGKRLGLPVWKMWGLDPAAAPLSSFTIGIDEPDVVRQKVREAEAYPILKVKVGTAHDETLLAAIRDVAPKKPVYVDANTGWTARQAVRALAMLEAYDVALMEQPVAKTDIEGLKEIRRHARIPIVADESCEMSRDVAKLVGAVDGVNIKLAKCGSLREAHRIVHTARAHGMSVMLGCMVESTLGIAAAVQLAPLVDWVDLDGAALLANDPFRGPGLQGDGTLRFNQEPGLGVTRAER
jgi:L-Ala-D/L-Glu epimerase